MFELLKQTSEYIKSIAESTYRVARGIYPNTNSALKNVMSGVLEDLDQDLGRKAAVIADGYVGGLTDLSNGHANMADVAKRIEAVQYLNEMAPGFGNEVNDIIVDAVSKEREKTRNEGKIKGREMVRQKLYSMH